jgi:hypothetical protein
MATGGAKGWRTPSVLAAALLVVSTSLPAGAAVAIHRTQTFFSSTCNESLETQVVGWMPQPGAPAPPGRFYVQRPADWQTTLGVERALALAERALRESAILGDLFVPVRIEIGAVSSDSDPESWEPLSWELFYAISFAGWRCANGDFPYVDVLVAMDESVTLPSPPRGGTAAAPSPPAAPELVGVGRLAVLGDELVAAGSRLVMRLDLTYRNLRCTLAGCPNHDLRLWSMSSTPGPRDVKLVAKHLSPRLLWFPFEDERPPPSPAQAVELAATALALLQHCGPGELSGTFVPYLTRARPGLWLYRVWYSGLGCPGTERPGSRAFEGEIVVLADGTVLLPTEGTISVIRRGGRDEAVSAIRSIRLASTRRYWPSP